MKIRKFNENSNIDIIEYVQDCFAEYIDSGSVFYDRINSSGYCAVIIPECFNIKFNKQYDCKELKDNIAKLNDIIGDVDVYIDRIKTKYDSDVKISVGMSSTDSNLQIIFTKIN
jgi:hypothetical protein